MYEFLIENPPINHTNESNQIDNAKIYAENFQMGKNHVKELKQWKSYGTHPLLNGVPYTPWF